MADFPGGPHDSSGDDDRPPTEKDSRVRDALLREFREIEVPEEEEPESLISLSSVFVIGGIALLVLAFFQARRDDPGLLVPPRRTLTERAEPRLLNRNALLSTATESAPAMRALAPSPRLGTPSPPPTPAPTLARLGIADLVDAVRNDEVCRVLPEVGEDPIRIALELPEFRGLSLEAQAIVRSVAPQVPADVLNAFRQSGSEWARYYEGLLLAGLTSGLSVPGDLDRARQIFSGLAGSHAGNGVFPYYLVAVLRKAAAPNEEIDEAIQAFSEASTFEDGSASVYQEILRELGTTVSGHSVALGTVAMLPVPDMNESYRVITERLNARPELAPALYEAATRFTQEEAEKAGGREFIDWSAMEISIFRALAKRAWMKFNEGDLPAVSVGGSSFTDYRDLLQTPAALRTEALNDLLTRGAEGRECREDEIRSAWARQP